MRTREEVEEMLLDLNPEGAYDPKYYGPVLIAQAILLAAGQIADAIIHRDDYRSS